MTKRNVPRETRHRASSRAILVAIVATLLAPSRAWSRDFFTIAVIPDTQNYVDDSRPQPRSARAFIAETAFLASHKDELRLAFVTHVGDVVQHGDGTNGQPEDRTWGAGAEWRRAEEAMDVLAAAGVPFAVSAGNHDYDSYDHASRSKPLHGSIHFRRHFGSQSAYFAGKPWYGGASNELPHNPGLSSYQTFSAGGRTFLHLSLELEPSDAVLSWAQRVIEAHAGYPTIVTTHAFLSPPADGDDRRPLEAAAPRLPASYLKGSPGGWNDAQGTWEKLIARNDQIFMVICGHAWNPAVQGVSVSQNVRIDVNDAGHLVYQVLSDYQGNTVASPGGDGWLRLMEFDLDRGAIHFTTYSPLLEKRAGQGGERTFRQPPRFSDFTLPMPVQVSASASAAVAR